MYKLDKVLNIDECTVEDLYQEGLIKDRTVVISSIHKYAGETKTKILAECTIKEVRDLFKDDYKETYITTFTILNWEV